MIFVLVEVEKNSKNAVLAFSSNLNFRYDHEESSLGVRLSDALCK
jgi:hypothetical protein